ncbi:hypothetical protein MBLNU13_g10636t1 [Cladosporium sp. NU13]
MSSPTASNGSASTASSTAQSQYQDRLISGRTAWSCTVTVGSQTVHARFWYDGQYVNNAREDAAERALQCFGQLPTPAGPQPAHLQQLQQRHYGAVSS